MFSSRNQPKKIQIMKKTILTLLFVSLIAGLEVYSQGKQLTLEDAVIGRWRELSPENIQGLNWIAEKNEYSFLKNNTLMQGSPRTDKTREILSLQDLSKIMGKEDNGLRRFPRFSWSESALMSFRHGNQWFLVDPFEKQLVKKTTFDEAGQNLDFCGANNHLAYTIKNNLYIKPFSGSAIQVTSDTNPDIVNGQEVHRREFGIHTGTFWSPEGNRLAFYRKDESMVSSYPLVNVNTRIATAEPVKYPMAGMKSHHVKVGVYDLQSQDTLFLETGLPRE
jgi:dipeptidyl-peptidase-4